MKKIFLGISLFVFLFTSLAVYAGSTYVRPYVRSDGTPVQGHYRSTPNDTKLDNWSTKDNVNPYTGKEGTVDPYKDSNTLNNSNGWNNSKHKSNQYCPYGNCDKEE